MRALAVLFLLAAITLPGLHQPTANAAPAGSRTVACGFRLSGEDNSAYRNLRCIIGVATTVTKSGMRVKPRRGPVRRVRFLEDTIFETDSGEGVLRGLAGHDHVCAAYAGHAKLVARIVAFNPSSNPCAPGKHLRPVDG